MRALFRAPVAALAALALLSAVALAQVDQVPLDLSGSFNMDSLCGPGEYQQCRYDGSHDLFELYGTLALGNGSEISSSQGQAVFNNASNPAWGYSIPSDYNHPSYLSGVQGFPADGVLGGGDRLYHMAGLTGNATLPGDWTESANPGAFTLQPNSLVIGAAHNRAQWQIDALLIELPFDQQAAYDDINFVLNGYYSNRARNMRIVAIYADDSEQELYAFATDAVDGPVMSDPASGGADFVLVASATHHYAVTSGATGSIRTRTGGLSLFEFAAGLPLDNTRVLKALRIEDVNPALNWASRGLCVWAATATFADTAPNAAPVADPGDDLFLTDSDEDGFEVAYLDASASYDPDGRILSAVWSENGEVVAVGLTPVLTLANGEHAITLTVTDNRGDSGSAVLLVDLSAPGPGHPVAEAGDDQTLLDENNSGDEIVVLDGSASYDPDGQIVSWDWSEDGQTIASGEQAQATLSTGVHTLRLTVADDEGKVRYDTVTINILDWRQPAVYHVSPDGDDANDGSAESPWKTPAHAVGQAIFGDTILLHEGIYRGGFGLTTSGLPGYPITLKAAEGEKAVISGARELSGWTPCASAAEACGNADWSNLYYVDVDWKPASVFQDNQPLDVSRTTGWWNPADGGTGLTLTDPAHLTEAADFWVGADLFIWFRSGTTHAHKHVVDFANGTLTLDSDFGYSRTPDSEDFYWLENKVELIDAPGQFASVDLGDGTYRVVLWPADNANPDATLLEGSTSDDSFLISWNSRGYWVIEGLEVRHNDNHAIGTWSVGGNHITIRGCQIHHNGGTGIYSRYNDGGLIEYNYSGYNGNGVTTGDSTDIVVRCNEIGDNWYDGLIVNSDDTLVADNYIHGHYFWGHPDNMQTYGDVENLLIQHNLFFNGGQQLMMEDTDGVSLVDNMIIFNRAYAVICGHNTTYDISLTGNTIGWPQYSSINTSGGYNYSLHDNLILTGMSYRDEGTLDFDNNLYWSGGRENIFNYSGSWNLTLASIFDRTGQEANSIVADPQFANVPSAWIFPSTDKLTQNTTTRAYMTEAAMADLAVGDYIELDMDGVVRIVTDLGEDWIEWDVPEPRALIRVTAIANWKDNSNFTLDLTPAEGSAALTAASDGGPVGSSVNLQQYLNADFDGDGVIDVPRWNYVDPAPPLKGGDANGDGHVNIDDFVILKRNYGKAGGWEQGDFDGDGFINVNDFIILKRNYNT